MSNIKNGFEIMLMVCIMWLAYNISDLLISFKQELKNSDVIEYQYKDFTNKDIDMAMKYHGASSVIIKELVPPYFIDKKGREVKLFTDECIAWIIKQKQGDVNNLANVGD